ncbi:GDYXXLXY domain-containing protein [Sulfurospirillum sp. UCH001]|uniref:GDYXXLXY domain-containing protein n=1 Tax=Sulfurospirillum sp. UCH001 TaxID=1581011 RepID=UPI00082E2EFB|nr:GDYXXLXY domain-containing protein [Sulfurospirillum sp. UCH001]
MKNIKQLLWALFGIVCFVQVGVIASQIISYERVLKEGEVFYFKVLPLDPYDPFRGRYVTLRFENAIKAPLGDGEKKEDQHKGYAILEHSEKGDSIKEIRLSKPQSGSFLEVDIRSFNYTATKQKEETSNLVYFSLPFDRFYMREDIAPKAEKVLRARSGVNVKAKLRVREGKGVIEDLMVEQTPLSQYVLTQ